MQTIVATGAAADWMTVVQLAVGALPAFGTLAVAYLVYRSSENQAAFNQAIATRATFAEEQNLKIALLERRAGVISAVRELSFNWMQTGQVTPDLMQAAIGAIRDAELIFSPEVIEELRGVTRDFNQWQYYQRMIDRAEGLHDEPARLQALQLQGEAEHRLLVALPELPDALRNAARIANLPPMVA